LPLDRFFGPFESAPFLPHFLAGDQQPGHPPSKPLLGLLAVVDLVLQFLVGGFQFIQLLIETGLCLLTLGGFVLEQSSFRD
jgi:hypothetical protein